jgi:hypothetical protein
MQFDSLNSNTLSTFAHRACRVVTAVSFASLIFCCAGCGSKSGLQRVVVEGRVTFDGEPVSNGDVMFYPTEISPAPLAGGSIKDGKYVASAHGGVPVGERRVEIRAYRKPKAAAGKSSVGEGPAAEQYLPEKFNARSELNAVVKDNSNPMTLNFELKND